MRKVPTKVTRAILTGDKKMLSRFGKHGAKMRAASARRAREIDIDMVLECEERARQAHEDICPVDE